jgi:imidazolonepropionase-like amidohydrolase
MKVYSADQVRTHTERGTLDNASVVVDDEGMIAWVGLTAELPAVYAELARSVFAGTIMPGLVDVHVHLGFDGGPTPVDRMTSETDSEQLVLMLRSARQLLSAGVTTARDLGARGYLDVVVRDAIVRGDARGPRLVVSGAPLTPTGGHCWFMGGEVDGAYELRKAVRRHHENGVDAIKIMSTGGFMTAGSAPWFAQFTSDELALAIDDAHRLGKKAVAHAHGTEGIRRAVAAGIDGLEHCTFVNSDGTFGFDPDVADEIAANGVFVSMTVNVIAWRMLADGGGVFVDHFTNLVAELRARGVRIVTGTDAGIDYAPHHAYAGGLEALHAFGMPVDELLASATTVAAESLGLGEVVGSLATDMSADFIVVGGDPVLDLGVLHRPSFVVAAGEEFVPDRYPDLSDLPSRAVPATFGMPHDH